MKVAFIGLGIMGSRMAANLLEKGADLIVYNRSAGPADELGKVGAFQAETAQEAVREADVVFSMLSTPEVVGEVFLSEVGALSSMKKGAIWAECSTVNPSFSRRCAQTATEVGIRFLDSPVAGTKAHAYNAELVYFIGGEEKDLEEIRPLLAATSIKILHIGGHGQGTSFKLLVNRLLAQSMLMFSEAVLFGQKLGIDREFLLDTVPGLALSAPFTKFKAEKIRANDYEVEFPLEWMHKDLHGVALTAYEIDQPLYLTMLVKELFADAACDRMQGLDFSAIYKHLNEK